MPLSDRQRAALPTLEWLLNPDVRADGRTMVIAVATIRVAAQRPGRAIPFFDHSLNRGGGRMVPVARAINMLTQGDVRLAPFTTLSDTALLLRIPRAIADWYPDEDSLGALSARQAGMQAGERLSVTMATSGLEAQQLVDLLQETLAGLTAANIHVNPSTVDRVREDLRQREVNERRRMNEMRSRQEEMIPDDLANEVLDMIETTEYFEPKPIEVRTPKPVKPKPKPRSAWERLLDDEEGEKS